MKWILGLLTLVAVGTWSWEQGFRFNATASLPMGVYRVVLGPMERGDLASVCLGGEYAELARERGYLRSGICPSGLQPLLKLIAALPGDTVRLDDNGLCVFPADKTLGCVWPAPRALDKRGNVLPVKLASGVVPQGQALLLAPHPGSFDGRYFGLMSLNALTRVQKITTFED